MLLPQVASRRRDDGALGNHELASRLNRHPDVFFTDEIERRLVWGRTWDSPGDRRGDSPRDGHVTDMGLTGEAARFPRPSSCR